MADARLTLDDPAAARAMAAIARHAAAEPDGGVSIRAEGDEVVIASPGATSLLLARLPAAAPADAVQGMYAAPASAPEPHDAGSVTLRRSARRLEIAIGRERIALDVTSADPIDVTWIWPGAEPAVEAVVSRDALLEALPGGEGRLTFSGADKQVVLEAGRTERRLPLKNRTRRRKDIGAAVAFDQLRQLVEAAGADVAVGLGDLRPLTVESGPVRGVLVRGTPMRWSAAAKHPAVSRPARTRKSRMTAPREEPPPAPRRDRDAERRAREREQEARRRARSAAAAVAAVGRAVSQVDAAANDAAQLDDEDAARRLAEARAALEDAAGRLRRHLDS
jgi:hypothetical protein